MRWTFLLLSTIAVTTAGQDITKEDRQKQLIKEMVDKGVFATTTIPKVKQPFYDATADAGQILDRIAGTFGDPDSYRQLEQVLEARLDRQIGATPASSGTTSLAMKGAAPQILGFAVEHGALTEKVDGNTVTFRGNPSGIVNALRGGGLLDQYMPVERTAAYRFFQPLSFAATFDTSKGTTGTPLANQQQLTSWSLRYVFVNRRDARLREYTDLWSRLAKGKGAGYSGTRTDLFEGLERWPDYRKWFSNLSTRVQEEVDKPWNDDHDTLAAAHRFQQVLTEEFNKIDQFPNPPDGVLDEINRYVRKLTEVANAAADIYTFANKGTLVTADWTTKRDPALPDLYIITGIYETSPGQTRKQDLTINSAASLYRVALKQNNRQFHDYTLTGQYDVPLGDFRKIPLVLSFAGKYEYVPNDTASSLGAAAKAMTSDISARGSVAATGTGATAGGSAVAPKGNLAVLQVKLTIPVKGSGVKIPLSFSVANRTELIKEKDVRANFGITFDLDAALASALGRKK